ncbi:MAG: ATP-binding protein [Cryomorphaceae bacterium]|nr:ATP-binding protein [Cryomorphaceae bacterium]
MKIVVTGTESTYKSTLTQALAQQFSFVYTKEYAREYLEEIEPDTPVNPMPRADYDRIEQGQLQSQKSHGYFDNFGHRIFDTDGITLYIWKADKYGELDPKLLDIPEDVIYFLCYPNVPAGEDRLRIDAQRRTSLHGEYLNVLHRLPNKVIHLDQPTLEARLAYAQKSIEELLNDAV